MPNYNAVTLVGNLTRDVETRTFPSGDTVASMSLAVTGTKNKTHFFPVKAFGKIADNASKYLSKGRCILVAGRLEHETWHDKDGQRHERISVVASNIEYLDNRRVDNEEDYR